MYTKEVKFYWFNSIKVLTISGKTTEEITDKCHALCDKWNAIHFEIL